MVITDRYDHVIDDKNRLAIPAQIRKAMDATLDGESFYVVWEGRYLQLIPEKLFERLTVQWTAGLTVPRKIAEARRLVFGTTPKLEMDKQGRCIVPERFLKDGKGPRNEEAILEREVTLMGVGDRLEIWNRATLDGHVRELMANGPDIKAAFEAPPTGPTNGPMAS